MTKILIRIQGKKGIIGLLVLWVLSLFLINIKGEFALIDDWAYAKSVMDFSEFGVFKIYDRIAITFISNLLWGSLFTKLFGFSFFVLRISTVVAGAILIYTFYQWLGLLTENQKLRVFCTAVLAFNPLFYVLSTTFMTDIFFLMNACISLYFFTVYLKNDKLNLLVWAFLFVIIASLSRQVGMVIPIAFLLVSFGKKIPIKHRLFTYGGVLISICSLILYYILLASNKSTPSHYTMHPNELYNQVISLNKEIVLRWFFYLYTTIVSLSVLLLPFSLYILSQQKVKTKKAILILSSCLLGFGLIGLFRDTTFPFNGQIINDYGIGGYFFFAPYSRVAQMSYDLPDLFNVGLISISAGVLIYVVSETFSTLRQKLKVSRVLQFLLWTAVLYYPCFGFVYVFDRYLLFHFILLIPLLILLFHDALTHSSSSYSAYFVLAVFGLFTLIGTHDYFEYNRTKTKALNDLTQKQKIRPEYIDGGMEFNAWHGYEKDFYEGNVGKDWWCIKEDDYLISIDKEVKGFTIYKEYPYSNWVGLKQRRLFVLKKNH
jgi:hypothetical protein